MSAAGAVEVVTAPLLIGATALVDVEDRVVESTLSLTEPLLTVAVVVVVALVVDPLGTTAAAALDVVGLVVEEDTTSICV